MLENDAVVVTGGMAVVTEMGRCSEKKVDMLMSTSNQKTLTWMDNIPAGRRWCVGGTDGK
jgi:hypothetical protein